MRTIFAVGVAGLGAACRQNGSPGDLGAYLPADSIDGIGFPDLAGSLIELTPDFLSIAAPQTNRQIPVDQGMIQLNAQGHRTKRIELNPDETVLVWLNHSPAGAAVVVRVLPSISAATGPIPAIDGQTAGSGETRSFGPLSLITRDGWGASPRRWVSSGESGPYDPATNRNGWLIYEEPLADQLHTLIVHHSALEFNDGPRAVQALHMTTARFADIGYHFLIDGLGQLYEGRPLNVRGAHTGGFNTGYIGVCLLGNFEIAPPLRGQLETLIVLTTHLQDELGIVRLGGHRDFQPGVTVCPGQNFHPQLRSLAEKLNLSLYSSK